MTHISQPQITVEDISPEIAQEWLLYNKNNRPLKRSQIDKFAADMRANNWRVNGEAIKFSDTGRLLDGQNRLHAAIQAHATFRSAVVRGLDDELDQMTMDTGARRIYADVLRMRGETNSVVLASATRSLYGWLKGSRSFGGPAVNASNAQLDATLLEHPELRDQITAITRISQTAHIPTTVLGAVWWAFHQLDVADADYFFERLISDVDHHTGDPILALRRLLTNRYNDKGVHTTMTYQAAFIIKAWNAYRDGRSVTQLTFKPGGASPEKFPEPH